jgi:predicted SnoaL-like aldol condensation-catalyzing enzyme
MVDGPTEPADLHRTEANRALVNEFIEEVLVGHRVDRLANYVQAEQFTQHNPDLRDGIGALRAHLEAMSGQRRVVEYERLHRVLAHGSFVLAVSEGFHCGVHTAFYDLFRVADGMLVEHWDTIEAVPPKAIWKNQNGKF